MMKKVMLLLIGAGALHVASNALAVEAVRAIPVSTAISPTEALNKTQINANKVKDLINQIEKAPTLEAKLKLVATARDQIVQLQQEHKAATSKVQPGASYMLSDDAASGSKAQPAVSEDPTDRLLNTLIDMLPKAFELLANAINKSLSKK